MTSVDKAKTETHGEHQQLLQPKGIPMHPRC